MPWKWGQDAAPCRAVPRVPWDLPARSWGGLVPPSLLPPHTALAFPLDLQEVWMTEQCKLAVIWFLIVKPGLIQKQPHFQALNLLPFPISGAKIHSSLRALQGMTYLQNQDLQVGFFFPFPLRREFLKISCKRFVLVLVQRQALLLKAGWLSDWAHTCPGSLESWSLCRTAGSRT